eukprot:8471201-Ditylum_brightwellii.AAC.1
MASLPPSFQNLTNMPGYQQMNVNRKQRKVIVGCMVGADTLVPDVKPKQPGIAMRQPKTTGWG